MITRREKTNKEVRRVKVLSKHFEQIAEDEKSDCGQCIKPALTAVDSNHVKNRKQFFEEQAHTTETSAGKDKPSNETNNKLEEFPYLKKRRSKEICACDVKSKRQIFEDYANSADNNKPVPTKPTENITLQQKRFYNDILNSTPVLNSNPAMKNNVIEDVPEINKEYVSIFEYSNSARSANTDEDVDIAASDREENVLTPDSKDEEYKSIVVEFDSIENCSTYDETNVNDHENKDFVGTKEGFTQRHFKKEEEILNYQITEQGYAMPDNNYEEGSSDFSFDKEGTTHGYIDENVVEDPEPNKIVNHQINEQGYDIPDSSFKEDSDDFSFDKKCTTHGNMEEIIVEDPEPNKNVIHQIIEQGYDIPDINFKEDSSDFSYDKTGKTHDNIEENIVEEPEPNRNVNHKITEQWYDLSDNTSKEDGSDLNFDKKPTTQRNSDENIVEDQEEQEPNKNLKDTAVEPDADEEDEHSKVFSTQPEIINKEFDENLIQNNENAAEESVSHLYDVKDKTLASLLFKNDEEESNIGEIEDEDASNYLASFANVNNIPKENLYQNYSAYEENEGVLFFSPNYLIDERNEEQDNENIVQNEQELSTNLAKNEDHIVKINTENSKETKEETIFLKSQENIDIIEHENNALLEDVILKPNTSLEHAENIYHNILQVFSIDDNTDLDENTTPGIRSFVHPRTAFNSNVPNEKSLRSQSPSEIHIEECISDVTEAFESINVLCNKPRWDVWDIAKKQEAATLPDLEDEVFGTILDNDSDFCVETYNNGEENVLFKIWYGREVLTQESESGRPLTNSDSNYDGDLLNKTGDEDPEYPFIDDDERDDISGTFFDKDENPRIEIIGDHRSSNLEIPRLDIPKPQYMIIKELLDSEEIYLNKLKYIIDNYLQHFRSLDVSPDIEVVFGNIEEICNGTETILSTLQVCVSIDEIARVFLTNVHVFDCYTEYMKNKRESTKYANEQFSELIKNKQIELEDQYTCESYFFSVMERPQRYKSLLGKLKKSLTKGGVSCEALNEAIIMFDRKIEETNTILAINSIKLCPLDLKEMEPFLMKETFNIKRKYKSVVFLFRGGVVFCVEDQNQADLYDYVEYIEMDKLAIRHSNSSMSFQLSCFDKSKLCGDTSQYEYNIEAPSMAVKEKWIDEIQRILWCQLQYYKDQQKNTTILNENKQHKIQSPTGDNDDQYEEIFVTNESTRSPDEYEHIEYFTLQDAYEEEHNKISGTFFDKDENPRIEIIRSESFMGDGTYMENVPKSQYMIIKELINTEETYLRKMKHIIDSYYLYFKNMGAPGDIQIVFGNIQDIYNETEKLYFLFLECDSVDTIAKVFVNNTHIFDLYTDYMRNKSRSYYYANTKFKRLIKDRQIELEDQYTCDSYLLNPVQRPGRYKLLLEKLQKELFKTNETCDSLRTAVIVVNEKITEANTLMTIDSIQRCPIDLQKMGPFIMKETFNIRRKYKSVIFLFKDMIVFCTVDPACPDTYVYADSIEMAKLTISHNRSSTTFQLRNFDKSKLSEENKYTFDVEAPSMSVKERWMEEIQRLLWGQLQYFKDQQKRTSLNKLGPTMSFIRKGSMKEKTKPYDSNSKSRKRSTFYYDIK